MWAIEIIEGSKMEDARFVVLGGGTGLSTLLTGLKRFTDEITAIVTMADDGGGSGQLRREKGILPPGDVRSCLVALANTEPLLESLLQYRYTEGHLNGQNFGNLLIAALIDIYGSFEEAIKRLSQVLNITGSVLPVTTDEIKLEAIFSNGKRIMGESLIPQYARKNKCRIERMRVVPHTARANQDCISAIEKSDVIILGPGSLYTSIIPNLQLQGIRQAILSSPSPLIYISNIMTQKGETDGYNLLEHIEALEEHGLRGRIQHIVLNTKEIDSKLVDLYKEKENVEPVYFDENILRIINEKGIQVEKGDFLLEGIDSIRHNALLLSQRLLTMSDKLRGF